MEKIQSFIVKFKSFCMAFFAALTIIVILLVLHRKLVSPNSLLPLDYPEVVFLNTPTIESDLALSQIEEVISPYTQTSNIVESDIQAMLNAINGLGWVENVAVERAFPNKLKFDIRSKSIIAYKLKNNQYYPITSYGEQLSRPTEFIGGLIALGDDVETEIVSLLQKLKRYPKLMSNLIAVQYVNGLRFNLILYSLDSNGLIVKLDNNFVDGIDRLMVLDALQGILSRNISEIDLRDLDKILIKPR